MPRGFGGAAFAAGLPDWVVALAGVVTQLGDMWFVAAAIAFVYVVSTRRIPLSRTPQRDALYLLALVMGSYGLTVALKAAFGLPRPPGAATATPPGWLPLALGGVYESMVTGDGFGFPSGHALKTTVVYGGAALTLSVWSRRRQLYAAGTVTLLVAASRVVLGVHYVVDVVVGALVGVGFLAAMERGTRRDPRTALLAAAGVCAVAVVIAATAKVALAGVVALLGLVLWERRWKPLDDGDADARGTSA